MTWFHVHIFIALLDLIRCGSLHCDSFNKVTYMYLLYVLAILYVVCAYPSNIITLLLSVVPLECLETNFKYLSTIQLPI